MDLAAFQTLMSSFPQVDDAKGDDEKTPIKSSNEMKPEQRDSESDK